MCLVIMGRGDTGVMTSPSVEFLETATISGCEKLTYQIDKEYTLYSHCHPGSPANVHS